LKTLLFRVFRRNRCTDCGRASESPYRVCGSCGFDRLAENSGTYGKNRSLRKLLRKSDRLPLLQRSTEALRIEAELARAAEEDAAWLRITERA